MSAIKNLLMDYMENKGIESYDALTSQDKLKFSSEYLSKETTVPEIVIEFFNSVIPKHDYYKRWIMLINKKDSANYSYDNIDDFLNGYSKYAPLSINTFFSPCLYDGWYYSSQAKCCNVIFLDIDGIQDIDLLSMTDDDLSSWLIETYNVPKHLLPHWVICTGHGVHLYFIVDELNFENDEDSRIRDYYTQMLICYFKADITCRNRNHILRLPFSNNCKQAILKTQLHKLNNSTDTSIKRLDYFYCDPEQINQYKIDCYKEITEKATKTRLENGNKSKPKNTTKTFKHTSNNKTSSERCVPLENMKYFDDFKRNARYWNIIKDLHNYYIRHNGNILGHRNQFIHIMATFLKIVHMPLDEATDFIEPYCTVDFLDEAVSTLTYVYTSEQTYHYNNDSIALLLGFTADDHINSYCCYSEASRQRRKKESMRRAKDKQYKEARQKKSEQLNNIRSMISDNPDMSCKDIADIFGLSTRTIQRIKKSLQ